jgi:antitoxin FitA
MNTHIQIRNVDRTVHRILKMRAAENDMTLTDYLKRLLEQEVRRPTLKEWAERAAKLPPVAITNEEIVQSIREDRDSR